MKTSTKSWTGFLSHIESWIEEAHLKEAERKRAAPSNSEQAERNFQRDMRVMESCQ
ncbi:MAG TPA: hypothetical protein VN667_13385 [Burkholderiales bacterium]|nr:hypothetical protein [Burkholderiales bacterium]